MPDQQQITPQEPSATVLTGTLAELIGPDKKFKTPDDIVTKINHADAFISKLESENKDLRTLLEQATTNIDRQAILEKLMTDLNPQTHNTNNQQQQPSTNQSQSLTSDDIVRLIEQREQAQKQQSNVDKAFTELRKVHGEKTDEFLTAKSAELGLSVDALKGLAANSPTAFLSAIGHSTNRQTSTSPQGVNTSAVLNSNQPDNGIRNKAYYDKLMVTMGPKKFILDRAIQTQLHKDMMTFADQWD